MHFPSRHCLWNFHSGEINDLAQNITVKASFHLFAKLSCYNALAFFPKQQVVRAQLMEFILTGCALAQAVFENSVGPAPSFRG